MKNIEKKIIYKAKCCRNCANYYRVSEDSFVGFHSLCKVTGQRIEVHNVCDDFLKPIPISLIDFKDE